MRDENLFFTIDGSVKAAMRDELEKQKAQSKSEQSKAAPAPTFTPTSASTTQTSKAAQSIVIDSAPKTTAAPATALKAPAMVTTPPPGPDSETKLKSQPDTKVVISAPATE